MLHFINISVVSAFDWPLVPSIKNQTKKPELRSENQFEEKMFLYFKLEAGKKLAIS